MKNQNSGWNLIKDYVRALFVPQDKKSRLTKHDFGAFNIQFTLYFKLS